MLQYVRRLVRDLQSGIGPYRTRNIVNDYARERFDESPAMVSVLNLVFQFIMRAKQMA